jgi:hypothetical protein
MTVRIRAYLANQDISSETQPANQFQMLASLIMYRRATALFALLDMHLTLTKMSEMVTLTVFKSLLKAIASA